MPKAKSQLSRKTRNARQMSTRRILESKSCQFRSSRSHGPRSAFSHDSDVDYINHKDVSISKMNLICEYCNAKKWPDEHNCMYCSDGSYGR